MLKRGSVLSAVAAAAGKLTLTSAGSEATAYGILLDDQVDTSVTYSDGSVTGSIARAGSFRGAALIVGVGTNAVALADRLRDVGSTCTGRSQSRQPLKRPQSRSKAPGRARVVPRGGCSEARKALVSLLAALKLRARIALVTFSGVGPYAGGHYPSLASDATRVADQRCLILPESASAARRLTPCDATTVM